MYLLGWFSSLTNRDLVIIAAIAVILLANRWTDIVRSFRDVFGR